MQDTVSMVHATIGDQLPEAGLHIGSVVYLAWDREVRRLFVVQWDRTRWWCSCGRGGCAHRLAANAYAFEESQKRRVAGEALQTYPEDESHLNP